MALPRCFHMQAGEYAERAEKKVILASKGIVGFVANNPLCSIEEIHKAGFKAYQGMRRGYIIRIKYKGNWAYRVNWKKFKKEKLDAQLNF